MGAGGAIAAQRLPGETSKFPTIAAVPRWGSTAKISGMHIALLALSVLDLALDLDSSLVHDTLATR